MLTWGLATSSLHSEGPAPNSDWGGWERAGWTPPSHDGNGFATRHGDDAEMAATHGFDAISVTLEWARLQPTEPIFDASARFDAEEVARYRRMLEALRAGGVQVWASLVHDSLPGWFSEDRRGFLDDGTARKVWPAHVDRIAETFGDLVDGWITIHEPVRYALDAWMNGMAPPGRRDADDFHTGLRRLTEADNAAARLLRVPGGAPVASSRWLPPVFPIDGDPSTRAAAREVEEVVWRSWREHDDHDLLGVSCRHALGVTADGSFHHWPRNATPVPLGWVAWPNALGETIHRLAEEHPGRQLLVTCTGTAGGPADDERRADDLRGFEAVVHDALRSGVPLAGCFWWSLADGYEGRHGFDVRTGIFTRDRSPGPYVPRISGTPG